ncbi:MAG TPA: hypothetical protein VK919_08040 [Solirubrobacterales bacterium]|nr:hypothetical protein [Solirubrobacterales bacterium]
MAKSLRPQLNQIRAWVRQGRTDAWIAHQLEVSTSELREFRRRHRLSAEDEGDVEADLRDEIEAEIAAAAEEEEEEEEEAEAPEDEGEEEAEGEARADEDGEEPKGRRRGRRRARGRGRRRAGTALEATFDHGEDEGYGLWLDPAVADDAVYSEHWAGHRKIEVTIEPDRIVIKRSE